MEVFLPQVINNKQLTKTACSSWASVRYINRKLCIFIKDILLILLDKCIKERAI